MSFNKLSAVLALSMFAGAASAQVVFNEVMVNPPGTDNGYEFFEFKSGTPGFNLTGLTLVVIEGDCGAGCVAGIIDQAIPLSGLTGSNNLLLLREPFGTPGPFIPDADPATTVVVASFTPDIENGANTFIIVEGFSGSLGQDLDVDNDGILDSQPWTRIVDSFGWLTDGPAGSPPNDPARGIQYATQLGGIDASDPRDVNDRFTADIFTRICDCAWSMDVLGTLPGPFFNDPLETIAVVGGDCTLSEFWEVTPGAANIGSDACGGGGPTCDYDFNQDENIDLTDAQQMAQVFVGLLTPEANWLDGDLNGDENADLTDAQILAAFVVSGTCAL
jgi:hypothetical protein